MYHKSLPCISISIYLVEGSRVSPLSVSQRIKLDYFLRNPSDMSDIPIIIESPILSISDEIICSLS